MAIHKGMILAAGLGTRLKPITHSIPKPLVPILNIPNIVHSLDLFSRAGITDVMMNLFHLPDEMEKFFKNYQPKSMKIHFSKEQVLMGTGGGVKLAEKFFGSDPFVLSNCDFVTNIDLLPFIQEHEKRQALATMVLLEDAKRAKHYSTVGVNKKSELCKMPKHTTEKPVREGIFTGIHILQSETLSHLKPEPCGINDLLYPILMKTSPSRVMGAFAEKSYWCDTGDVPMLLEASQFLLKQLTEGDSVLVRLFKKLGIEPILLDPLSLIGKNVQIDSSASIQEQVIIGDNCKIEAECVLSRCVVLDGSTVPKGSQLRDLIFFRGASISAKSPV